MEHDLRLIGNKIYAVRKSKNIKQNEMSKQLGIRQSSYSRLENGEYDIPLTKLIQLCEILDISVAWLLSDDSISRISDKERLLLIDFMKYLESNEKDAE